MKRFVNGEEVELTTGKAEVTQTSDRLLVRSVNGTHSATAVRLGDTVMVSYRGQVYEVTKGGRTRAGAAQSGEIKAPMPGSIVEVYVEAGDEVRKGDRLLVLEAMKTQQPFNAPFDGKIVKVEVVKGQQVNDGALLVTVVSSG